MSRSPNIRHQLTLLAIAITVGIAALQPPPHASAEDCPTPRMLLTTAGPTTVIDPDLCELTLTEGASIIYWNRPTQRVDLALAGRFDPADGVTLWHHDPARPGWSAWGLHEPADIPVLETLEPGQIYFIATPNPTLWNLRSPDPSPFDGQQVVSFYGYPGIPGMGALGRYTPAGAIAAASIEAARYDALNGDINVVPAVQPIVAVAQRYPGADGTYLAHMSHERITEYVEAAREAGALVILDIQVGWADPVDELRRLEPYLLEPFVHIALDPEFATKTLGVAPGQRIGSLHADQINAAQQYLATLVRKHGLPPKALIIHQFLERMIREPERIETYDEIDLTIDMDGFRAKAIKLVHYRWYALADYAERPAIKLFYVWDTPLMSPAEIQAFEVPPALIIYQ